MIQTNENTVDRLEREADAADFLGVAPHTLACWRSQGRGPRFVKYGEERSSAVRYRRSELLKYVADPVGYEKVRQARAGRKPKSQR